MPPKKGKKGKGKDDDWGDDNAIEEKMKKLMVNDEDEDEVRPNKKGKSKPSKAAKGKPAPVNKVDSDGDVEEGSSEDEDDAPSKKMPLSKKGKARLVTEKPVNEDEDDSDQLIKKFEEEVTEETVTKYISSNSLPLVVEFNQNTAQKIFSDEVKSHL